MIYKKETDGRIVKISNSLYEVLNTGLQDMLRANYVQLRIQQITQGQSGNIFFNLRGGSGYDFRGEFHSLLGARQCIVKEDALLSLHGHFKTSIGKKGAVARIFDCIHYKIEDGQGILYIGILGRDTVAPEFAKHVDKQLERKKFR